MKRKRNMLILSSAVALLFITVASLNSMKHPLTQPALPAAALSAQSIDQSEHHESSKTSLHTEQILNEIKVIFNGQVQQVFTVNAKSSTGTQTLQIHMKNTGTKSFTYYLDDPTGERCAEVTIAPGKKVTTQYTWIAQQAGDWMIRISNADGSQGAAAYSIENQF
ncbi:hypothetical protein [Paenibacillus sp. Z6-24]